MATAGLSAAEARSLLERFGPNTIPRPAPPSHATRLWHQLQSPLVYILIFALVVDLGGWIGEGAGGVPLESTAIALILLLNVVLGAWQEHKAEAALEALRELSAPQAWARRDGRLVRIPGAALVPGDLIRLYTGDRVPADAVTLSPEDLLVDESLLTGESIPVEKERGAPIQAGTVVVRGRTAAEVTNTGTRSAMGRLAGTLGEVQAEPTPLERRLAVFGRRVAAWVLVIAALVFIGGVWGGGRSQIGHAVLFAAAVAVAAVPEGLPAVLTLTLRRGVQHMARRQAVVRRLVAVEALGSVTVIATDKTGTLTENWLRVRDLDAPDRAAALRAIALACDPEAADGGGDPIDAALVEYATAALGDLRTLHALHPRQSARHFDPTRRFSRVTVVEDTRPVSYVKGAPEVLLVRCDLSEDERQRWHERIVTHAARGFRLLAVARAEGEEETGLTWLGLVLLWDPPRPEVPAALDTARRAGIRVLMITGDHPETARTLARSLGIDASRVVTGVELAAYGEAELAQLVREVAVFARVAPEQKLHIVEALQRAGEIVAVTGDGVNDAPALKRADVGVAMGRRGSDVAREVADLVLLDDNFATIVAAVEEGRSIYENIQKTIRFLFSTNFSEILVVALGAAVAFLVDLRDASGALLLPLTAVQLLWINLITDGAPALAIGLDKNPGVMRRAPRDPRAPLLDTPSLRFILFSGTAKALVAFATLALLPRLLGQPLAVTATANFLFMAAGQLLFAYPARYSELHPPHNPVLHGAVTVSFAAQLPLLLAAPLRGAFGTAPLPGLVWLWVAGSVVLSWALAQGLSRLLWAERHFRAAS